MELKNCRRCGRVYQRVLGNVCPSCTEKMDEDFVKIRGYIDEHPSANISIVAEETGVPERTILQLLRDGRLEFYKAAESLECKRCGVWIKVGSYCEDCIKKLKTFMEGIDKNTDKNKGDTLKTNVSKMYTFDNIKKRH
jgi:predicted amidophosphoribosyltransferase